MGFLDAKTRVLDVVLTDLGRHLFSQNLLEFEFYVFSDEGVDYGAALTASLLESGSVDNFVRRTPMFEGTQRKDSKEQTDLSTFLYTIPPRRITLPKFVTNFDDSLDLEAKRRFYIDLLVVTAKNINRTQEPIAVIAQGVAEKESAEEKMSEYVAQQQHQHTQTRLVHGANAVGMPIALNQVVLNEQTILNVSTGLTSPVDQIQTPLAQAQAEITDVISLKDEVEVVLGLDRLKINFSLESSEGEVAASSGYLVEIYESGSDGTIVKLFEEDVIDVLEGDVLKKGFEQDLFFDGDAENADLISEGERLRKKELRKRELKLERLQKRLQQKIKESLRNF